MVVDSFFIKHYDFVGNAGAAKRCIPYVFYYTFFILKSKEKPYPLLFVIVDTVFFIFLFYAVFHLDICFISTPVFFI